MDEGQGYEEHDYEGMGQELLITRTFKFNFQLVTLQANVVTS
jgi:hypothetical protein